MTTSDFIKRRIELKEQLIILVRWEIEALERELLNLERSPKADLDEGKVAWKIDF